MESAAANKILDLESPVHRALVHVASVGRAALAADVAAVRLFDDPDLPRNSYVEACLLHLTPHDEADLFHWPRDGHGLFARQNHQPPTQPRTDLIFQPLRDGGDADELYRPIQTFIPVVDDLCTTFPVADRCWCLAAFLHCEGREPFSQHHVHLRSDMTERQIAQTLGRSRHTIHVHVKNIYRKLNVSSRRELTQLF